MNYLGEIEEVDDLDSFMVDEDTNEVHGQEYMRTCRNGKCGCKKGAEFNFLNVQPLVSMQLKFKMLLIL